MKHFNQSDKERDVVIEFNRILNRSNSEDKVIFDLWDYEIASLVKEGLIEPEPLRSWFDKIFWRNKQWRVVTGYPNAIIYKREIIPYAKMM